MADQTNISKAQKLLEEMNAKYGATPSAPAQQPTQPPQQQVQPPQQRGLVNDAMSLIKGRQQQIDKASGYARGGKIVKRAFEYGGLTDGAVLEDDGGLAAGLAAIELGKSRDSRDMQQIESAFASLAGYSCGGKVKAHADGGKVSSNKDSEKSILLGAAEVAGNGIMKAAKGAGEMMRWATGGPPPVRHDNPPPYVDSESHTKDKKYASGGKVKTIKGPGTSTSDSIPAKVKETGEPILVSNGERILSKKQDKLLEKIAKMLGYETTDDLLASGTGRPVGPTMKDGKKAAALGWNNDVEDEYTNAVKSKSSAFSQMMPNTSEAIASAGKDIGTAVDAGNYANAAGLSFGDVPKYFNAALNDVFGNPARQAAPVVSQVASGLVGNVNSTKSEPTNPPGLLKEATAPGYGPQDGPQQAAGSATNQATSPLITGRNDKGIITADSAQSAYGNDMGRSGKVFGTYDGKGVNDILARENAARADMIAMSMPQVGGTAPGILGNGSLGTLPGGQSIEEWNRNVGVKTQLGLDPKSRVAYEDQVAKNNTQLRGQDMAREASMYGNDVQAQRASGHDQMLMRGQDMQAQAEAARLAGTPMDNRIKGAQVSSLEELAKLRGNLLNAKTPEEQAKATALLRAYSGNTEENKPWAHVVGGGVDEVTGQQRPQYIVTGRGDQATTASTGADIAKRGQRIGNSPYDEGTILNKDGKKYVVKNGQPVLAS